MTARITLRAQGEDFVSAELDDDGVWTSDDPLFADMLNRGYSPEVYPPSPAADASPYVSQARAAAKDFNAELEWPDLGTTDPTIIH